MTVNPIKKALKEIIPKVEKDLASVESIRHLDAVRVRYLGRKGLLTGALRQLPTLDKKERPAVGKLANELKLQVQELLDAKAVSLKEKELKDTVEQDSVDITLPGTSARLGHVHPLTSTIEEICDIFISMGFSIAKGPDIESDYYNFEALNFPSNHPARDMHDTIYVTKNILLRTHTSPVQIRVMEKQKPPLAVIVPGKSYRCDTPDVTHSPMFHQVEGFQVDEGISFADLKGVLTLFVRSFFGEDTELRFRPSFFPFTEPSAEVDIRCVICKGSGCRVCSETGWLEVLGSGMIHPSLFEVVGYDKERYSGYAFGMGVERLAMLKYGIDDIRLFFENDVRFLNQF